jgi:hypothetical protein
VGGANVSPRAVPRELPPRHAGLALDAGCTRPSLRSVTPAAERSRLKGLDRLLQHADQRHGSPHSGRARAGERRWCRSIGTKVTTHGRDLIFQMAEVAVPIAISARPRSAGFPDEDQAMTERRSLAGRARPALHTGTKRASARACGTYRSIRSLGSWAATMPRPARKDAALRSRWGRLGREPSSGLKQ